MAITQEFLQQVQTKLDELSPLRKKKERGYIKTTLVCISATKTEACDVAPMMQIVSIPQILECFGIPPAGFHEKQVMKCAQAFIDAECNLFRNLTGHDATSENGQRILNDDTILSHTYGRLVLGHPTLPEYADKSIYMNAAMGINERMLS